LRHRDLWLLSNRPLAVREYKRMLAKGMGVDNV
jgi:hypothetical protein